MYNPPTRVCMCNPPTHARRACTTPQPTLLEARRGEKTRTLSIHLVPALSIYLSMYVCMYLSIYLSLYLSISIYLSIYLSEPQPPNTGLGTPPEAWGVPDDEDAALGCEVRTLNPATRSRFYILRQSTLSAYSL